MMLMILTLKMRYSSVLVMAQYTEAVVNGRKVLLDEDGRPCRTCNTLQDFLGATGGKLTPQLAEPRANPESAYRRDPPDREELGNHTWTLLHSMAARYPANASMRDQQKMRYFIDAFSEFYPCSYCASDFREWISEHEPDVRGRDELGQWLCSAHNAVNSKLGKPSFDCSLWRKRWRDGWD